MECPLLSPAVICNPDERNDIRDDVDTGPGFRFAHPGYVLCYQAGAPDFTSL
jgi:hypothetical protein